MAIKKTKIEKELSQNSEQLLEVESEAKEFNHLIESISVPNQNEEEPIVVN